MEVLRIEILNPKANKLLNDLADLDLISIKKDQPEDFYKFLNKIRSKSKQKISLHQITQDVESVRKKRNANKQKKDNS
jgi:hypothetical protein